MRRRLEGPARLSDRGASAVEYGLLIAAVAAVVVVAIFALGGMIDNTFTHTNTCIENRANPC